VCHIYIYISNTSALSIDDEILCYICGWILFSGISAAKRLSDAGITDLLILEATDHIGGRMHKKNFAGINVEVGANWVEGVNSNRGKMNPIWPIVNSTLKLRNFRSDFDYLAQNVYKEEYVRRLARDQLMSSASYYSVFPSVKSIVHFDLLQSKMLAVHCAALYLHFATPHFGHG